MVLHVAKIFLYDKFKKILMKNKRCLRCNMTTWKVSSEQEAQLVISNEKKRLTSQRMIAALMIVGIILGGFAFVAYTLRGNVTARAQQILGFDPNLPAELVNASRNLGDNAKIVDTNQEDIEATGEQGSLDKLMNYNKDNQEAKDKRETEINAVAQEIDAGKNEARLEIYSENAWRFAFVAILFIGLYITYFINVSRHLAQYRKREFEVTHGKYTKKRTIRTGIFFSLFFLTVVLEDESTLEAEVTREIYQSVTFQSDILAVRMNQQAANSRIRAFITRAS